MDLEMLWKCIKQLCNKHDVTITQLEKELGFSPGSMTKWRQSAPSIEKVLLVADYFNITVDEICGKDLKRREDEEMAELIKATKDKKIFWMPCSVYDLMYMHFYPSQMKSMFLEMYKVRYLHKDFFIGTRENSPHIFEFYVCFNEHVAFKIVKDTQQLTILWHLIGSTLDEIQTELEMRTED